MATGLEKVSFHSNPKAGQCQWMFKLPHNCTHFTWTRSYSKFSKLGFNSIWTENFQMYKLDLETAEEPEVNCQRLLDHRESKRIPEKISTSVSLTMLKPLTVWITTNSGKFLQMGIPDHLTCLLRNLYVGQEATVRTRHGTTDWFQIGKGVCQGCIS